MKKKFLIRLLVAVLLGIWFGFVCTRLASWTNPDIRWTPLMRSILFNRFLIGMIIGLLGVYTVHPAFWFKCLGLRGLIFGAIISIQIAIGVFMVAGDKAQQIKIFWMTILAWAVYGLIIDLVATRLGGQWTKLLHNKNK